MIALGTVYNDIFNSIHKFAGLEKRFRAERFVFDIQFAGGGLFLLF